MHISTAILYASVDGQTQKICERLKEVLIRNQHSVFMSPISDFDGDVSSFEKLIIGSSIRYGKHHPEVINFIGKRKNEIEKTKNAFFSVNLVARKINKNSPQNNPYLIKFLKRTQWTPDETEVFAGRIDYKRYSFFDSLMIRIIMLLTKGPIGAYADIEYTDWHKVDEFAERLCKM